jgi:hypothetical protein
MVMSFFVSLVTFIGFTPQAKLAVPPLNVAQFLYANGRPKKEIRSQSSEGSVEFICDPSGVEAIFAIVTGGIGRVRPQPPAISE